MSQAESNAVDRILSGKQRKFTVVIHKPDGSKIEFQTDDSVGLDWNNESRALWVATNTYPKSYICEYEKGMIILAEKNPGTP